MWVANVRRRAWNVSPVIPILSAAGRSVALEIVVRIDRLFSVRRKYEGVRARPPAGLIPLPEIGCERSGKMRLPSLDLVWLADLAPVDGFLGSEDVSLEASPPERKELARSEGSEAGPT
jgi:hypothetical protein